MENKNVKKVVKITDKQKAARKANLAKGREKRMETIKQKKEDTKNEEYDLSSNDGDNDVDESSSDDDLIISRKKPTKTKQVKKDDNSLKNELDELKNMVIDLATLQKKQNKQNKQKRSNGGTKIVVLPNNQTQQQPEQNTQSNHLIDALRRSLM